MNHIKIITTKNKRKMAVRKKIFGTVQRPRLNIFRSNRYIYLQLITDTDGKVLLTTTDAKNSKLKGTKTQKASALATEFAKAMNQKKITQIVFDRGPYKYHGRVKAVAEALREAGIIF